MDVQKHVRGTVNHLDDLCNNFNEAHEMIEDIDQEEDMEGVFEAVQTLQAKITEWQELQWARENIGKNYKIIDHDGEVDHFFDLGTVVTRIAANITQGYGVECRYQYRDLDQAVSDNDLELIK